MKRMQRMQRPPQDPLVGLQRDQPGSPGWVAFTERQSKPNAICAARGVSKVHPQLVHVPKAGGMTFSCTFQIMRKSTMTGCPAANDFFGFDGRNHETYFQLVTERQCKGAVYRNGGANCKPTPGTCMPLVSMMAHPVDRFVASFYQNVGRTNRASGHCGFLGCRVDSTLMRRHNAAKITVEEAALWPRAADLEPGLNEATKFFGLNQTTVPVSNPMTRYHIKDDPEGRAMLKLAKERMDEMDFIGLTARYMDSIELMAWRVGIPLSRICSCNINAIRKDSLKLAKDLSPQAKDQIEERNALDMELYEHAVAKFERDFDEYLRALGDTPRNSFICDRDNIMCKYEQKWFTPESYVRRVPANFVNNGIHSECTFHCVRERKFTD